MKKIFVLILAMMAVASGISAQCRIVAKITDSENHEPLLGATVYAPGLSKGAVCNIDGLAVLENVPCTGIQLVVRYIGYKTDTVMVQASLADTVFINLERTHNELSDVVIVSTRSSRSIQDIPTRVEFVSEEELDEKSNMKSGDIRMLLSESTGVVTQPTSATSGNSSIRIQGLDGRYTQVLKDGFPVFAGAASGLGLLQTPPLDLRQVEIVKGASSTLYGGGAIAGIVNLVSKTPTSEPENKLHFDYSHTKGFNANAFFSRKYDKIGTTVLTTFNHNGAYAPKSEVFSAIPRFNRVVVNPRLFAYFNPSTELVVGINGMMERREGGDMDYLTHNTLADSAYFENNDTKRMAFTADFSHKINDKKKIEAKASWSWFDRTIDLRDYRFQGTQKSLFAEVNHVHDAGWAEWIVGANVWDDIFNEVAHTSLPVRNSDQLVVGAFVQSNFPLGKKLALETGLRYDYVDDYGAVFLPRFSLLYHIAQGLTSRLGAGMGYKTPTIFTEETELVHYRNVLPIGDDNQIEKSYGGNWDINYRTALFDGKVSFSLNQMFFYTFITNPLLMKQTAGDMYAMVNIDGHIDTKGFETNLKLGYDDLHLYLGYTFTDAQTYENQTHHESYLTSKHRVNAILMYEAEDKWRIGLESYYYGKQLLTDGSVGKQYTMFGLMVERFWSNISLYINFENFTDRRQSRFGSIYTGNRSNPTFNDLYMPIEGFVFTLGAKIKW